MGGEKLVKNNSGMKKKKVKIDKELQEKDPYLKLGYGMIAYRNLLETMICMFLVFTILLIPAFYIFYHGDGL